MTRLFQILAVLALLTVTYMSLRPGVSMGSVPHTDKVLHLLAYGLIGGLARLGWPKVWGGWLLLAVAGAGVAIELAQHFMGLGRTGSVADALANTLGVGLVLAAFHLLTRNRQN